MKLFSSIPKKLVCLLLATIMVVTMVPAQGLLSIAVAESAGVTSQLPEEGTGLPGEVVEGPVEPLPIFQLTVYYVYGESAGADLAGSPAAQTHVKTLAQGSAYSIPSPAVTGYAPDTEIVTGTLDADTELSVTYEVDGTVEYTVVHTFAGLLGDGTDDRVVTETKSGAVGTLTQAVAKDELGFTAGEFEQADIAPDGNTSIAISYSRNEYTLYFITDGGSYVDTQIKKFGETVSLDAVTKPKKPSYTFGGWFSDAGCTTAAGASFAMPAQDVELYALWTGEDSKYTVLFWLEQADPQTSGDSDYGYDYHATLELSAAVKSTVTAGEAMAAALVKNPDMVPAIYEYDATDANNQESVTLSGTGEEVLNIYLNRKSVTVKFQTFHYGLYVTKSLCHLPSLFGTHDGDGNHSYSADFTEDDYKSYKYPYPCAEVNGVWKKQEQSTSNVITTDYLTVTGRAGEKFGVQESKAWPDKVDGKTVQWLTSPDGSVYQGKMERMPLASVTYYAKQAPEDASLFQINYLVEMLPEDTSTAVKTKNGKNYKLHSQSDFWSTKQMGLVDDPNTSYVIAGFTCDKAISDDFPPINNPKLDVYPAYVYNNRNDATITFGAVGSDVEGMPASITRLFDEKIGTAIAEPIRKGYAFAGWSTAQYGTSANFILNADTTMPAGGAVLYPLWKPESYTVTFALNHDGAPAADVQQVLYQKLATQPTDPVRAGYKFMGWYTTATGSQRYVFDKPVEDNVTLYAQWTADTIASYTLNHVDVDTGKVLLSETKDNITVGTSVTVNAQAIAGYAPLLSHKNQVIVAGNNVIVLEYKAFEALPYTVQYVDTEGNPIATEKRVNNDGAGRKVTVTENFVSVSGYTPDRFQKTLNLVYEETIEKNVITFTYTKNKPGVYIVYHYVAAENGDQYVMSSDGLVELPVGERATATPRTYETHTLNTSKSTLSGIITSDHVGGQTPLVLKVYYDWKEYDVTYNPNNTVPGNTAVTQPVKHGKTATAAPADTFVAAEHKVFLGWSENALATTPTYKAGDAINNVTAPKTLYAVWGAEAQYTLTYNSNDGKDKTFDGGKHYDKATVATATLAQTGFTAPTGTKLLGWRYGQNTSFVAPGAEITFGTANVILYAVWGDMSKNTVTYNGNGGKLGDNTSWVEERFENATATVSENKFVNDGYKFAGWSDGTKSWEVNETVPAGTDLTLTAQWEKDNAKWVTISYDANGGTNAPTTEEYLRSELTATLAAKGGMTNGTNVFGGWSATAIAPITTPDEYNAAQSKLITEIALSDTPYSKYTVYAVWYVDVNGPEGKPDGTPDALQHKALYNGNGNISGTAPVDTNLYSQSDKVSVKSGAALRRTEAVIVGWSTALVNNVLATKTDYDAVVDSGNFYTAGTEYTMADAAVTFHAVWAIDKNGDDTPDYDQFTVTYLPGAADTTGETVDSTLYSSDATVTVLANGFSRPDYMFTGWVSNAGTQADAGATFPITASITFTAQWELDKNGPNGGPDGTADKDQYAVTYNANGGTGPVPTDANIYSVDYAAPVKFDTTPTKTGYDFLGWSTNPAATAPTYTADGTNTVSMVKDGVTLYAIYGAQGVNYTVRYVSVLNGAEKVLGTMDGTGVFNEQLELLPKHFEGYTPNITSQTVTLGATGNNFTLYYTPVEVRIISHYLDAATSVKVAEPINHHETEKYYFGEQYTLQNTKQAIEGYTVREDSKSATFTVNSTSGHLVEFLYDAINYTITYNPNNVAGNTAILDTVRYGGTVAVRYNSFAPESRKVFLGWSTDAQATAAAPAYLPGTELAEVKDDHTLYAVWGNEPQYTLTYHANNDSLQTYAGGSYYADQNATAASVATTGFAAPSGKKFVGWSDSATGGIKFEAGTAIPMASKTDLALYAIWVEKDIYSVSYSGGSIDGSNGHLPDSTDTSLREEREEGLTAKVKSNPFVNDGYSFTGWLEGQATEWNAGDTIPANVTLTLTAQWQKDPAQWGKLIYDANGGSNPPATLEYKLSVGTVALAGQSGTLPATPNLLFGGWTTERFDNVATPEQYTAATAKLTTAVQLVAGDNTVFALWLVDANGPDGNPDGKPDALQFKVTYQSGAADATGQTEDTYLYSNGDLATLKDNGFSRDAYLFNGWSIANITANPGNTITVQGNTEVTALWTPDKNGPDGKPDQIPDSDEYSVTYDANGGTGPVPEDDNIYPAGYATTPVQFSPVPGKSGYTFLGWDTAPDAVTPTYTAAGTTTLTMPQDGIKLYAIYGAADVTYSIRYISRRTNKDGVQLEKTLAVEEALNGRFSQQLTLTAKEFAGYHLTSEPTLTVTLGLVDNQYTFYYAPNTATVVSHYLDSATNLPLLPDNTWSEGYQFGVSYEMAAPQIVGFTATAPSISFAIQEEPQHITFYYNRNDYAYEVRYQTASGSTLVVPTTGRAAYQSAITASPVAVPGYTARDAQLSLQIGVDETKNILTFIYDIIGGGGNTDDDDDDDDNSSSSGSSSSTTTPPATVDPAPITPVTPPEVEVTPPAEVEIDDEDTPLAPGTQITGPTEVIDDNETPLAAGPVAWALLNLLLTILTAVLSLVLLVGYYTGKKKKEDEEQNAETAQKDDLKRKGWMRLVSLVPTIGAIVAFILTENMRNPMVWTDRWTLLMAIIALLQIGVAFCCRKEREDDKEDSDKEMPSTNAAPQNA